MRSMVLRSSRTFPGHEYPPGFGTYASGQGLGPEVVSAAKFSQEARCQFGDVFGPFAQCRDPDRYDAQSVVQILTKTIFRNQFREGSIGG